MTPGDAVSLGGTTARGSRLHSRNTVPPDSMIDVWWFDTRTVTVGPSGLAALDRGERARAEAFMFPADRHRYQVAHMTLRLVLASYTGTPAGQLSLGREQCPHCGAAGKPVLLPGPGADTVPSFSLAHSGDMVIIAVAGRPVGVDVERDAAGCVCSLAEALHPAVSISLSVNPTFEAAVRLYRSRGFEPDGCREAIPHAPSMHCARMIRRRA